MAELDVTSRSGAPETVPPPRGPVSRAPALENGDRLTRCEFERRYALRPDLKKAQLIEGVVYMPSPVGIVHASTPTSTAGSRPGWPSRRESPAAMRPKDAHDPRT